MGSLLRIWGAAFVLEQNANVVKLGWVFVFCHVSNTLGKGTRHLCGFTKADFNIW